MASFRINGDQIDLDVSADTPLLWVIREHLKLTGTRIRHLPLTPEIVKEALSI